MSLNNEERDVCRRIKHLFELSGMNQIEFSRSIGITQAALSNVINEKSVPGSSFIMSILREFQNVNSRWLFLGEDPIFSTPDQQINQSRKRVTNNIIHKSSGSVIESENNNKSSEDPEAMLKLKEDLRSCEEDRERLRKSNEEKSEEIIKMSKEIIDILKQKI